MIEFLVLGTLALGGLVLAAIFGTLYLVFRIVTWAILLPVRLLALPFKLLFGLSGLLLLPFKLLFLPFRLLFKLAWLPFGLLLGGLGMLFGLGIPLIALLLGGAVLAAVIGGAIAIAVPLMPFLLLALLIWALRRHRTAIA